VERDVAVFFVEKLPVPQEGYSRAKLVLERAPAPGREELKPVH
jgi:hypothetical protein